MAQTSAWFMLQADMALRVVRVDDDPTTTALPRLVGGLDITYDPAGVSTTCIVGLVVVERLGLHPLASRHQVVPFPCQ